MEAAPDFGTDFKLHMREKSELRKRWSQKSELLSIDTALRLRGKILKSGQLSRNNLAARSLLVGRISEIR